MILPTHISNESNPAGPLAGDSGPDRRALVALAKPDHASCSLQIDRVVREIESPEVREIVQTVFKDLIRLLECLSLTENHLRQADVVEETFALFQLVHDEALLLVKFIRDEGLNCPALSEELSDTLDGITFAVSHDLQRVFETGQRAATPDKTAHVMVGKSYRAHDLLTNCLQQSTITLAMVFDSELVGARLFNNSDMRYRQSLQLCDDLSALWKLVEASEKNIEVPGLDSLTAGIEKFRNESLECLMYSDWPQFESFCERIKVAGTTSVELEPVLHQFRCYLETLLGHVRMRAVLANVSPLQFGADETTSLESAEQSTDFFSSADLDDDSPAWDVFAVA